MMSFVKKMLMVVFAGVSVMHASGQSSKFVIKKTGPDYYLEHKVQPKETWYSVGRAYLLSPKVISAFNELSMDKGLSIGQQIKIPLTADNFNQTDNGAFTGPAIVHVVAQGEGLLRLANVYKVSVAQLKEWNRLTSDQLNLNANLIIGFLQAPGAGNIQPANQVSKEQQQAKTTAAESAPKQVETPKPQPPAPVQPQQEVSKPVQEKPAQQAVVQKTPTPVNVQQEPAPASSSTASATGYFSGLFQTQSKEGKLQKMETPAYGVFKSTSGWQDAKYYVLMNNVVPGTVLRITSKNTGRQVYAKVLGAVPPGKESEGLLLRISNAAAAALGVPNGEPGVFELVWSN
jgi:LysM repeat protein